MRLTPAFDDRVGEVVEAPVIIAVREAGRDGNVAAAEDAQVAFDDAARVGRRCGVNASDEFEIGRELLDRRRHGEHLHVRGGDEVFFGVVLVDHLACGVRDDLHADLPATELWAGQAFADLGLELGQVLDRWRSRRRRWGRRCGRGWCRDRFDRGRRRRTRSILFLRYGREHGGGDKDGEKNCVDPGNHCF